MPAEAGHDERAISFNDPEQGFVALAYVRREVAADAVLALPDGRSARQLG